MFRKKTTVLTDPQTTKEKWLCNSLYFLIIKESLAKTHPIQTAS